MLMRESMFRQDPFAGEATAAVEATAILQWTST